MVSIGQNEEVWALWTNETKRKFDELSQCLVDQYSEFQLHGEFLNGTLTLSENLADHGKKHVERILCRNIKENYCMFFKFSCAFKFLR